MFPTCVLIVNTTYLGLVAIFVTIVRLICIHLEQATVNIQSSSLNSGKVSRFDLW